MSADFDGVDDVLTSDATQTWGSLITVATWFNADSMGEGNAGAFFQHGATTTERLRLIFDGVGASNKLQIFSFRDATGGVWVMTSGFGTLAGWKFVALSYDLTSNANDPTLYTFVDNVWSTLTVGAGLTEAASPTGNPAADNQTLYIGNRAGLDLTFDGRFGEWVMWKRLLPFAEVQAVALIGVNAIPDYFNYLPLQSGSLQRNLGSSGTTFTLTGAVAAENPPIRPAGRRG